MISKELLARLREEYPKGTKVEVIEMNDPFVRMEPGTIGVVDLVDDTGTIFCTLSNGHSLGAVYGIDRIRKISE